MDITTEQLLAALAERLAPANAPAHATTWQFRFDAAAPGHATVADGTVATGLGDHPQPTLTVCYDTPATALAHVTAELDVMAAFMAGRFRADGHIVLAMTLPLVFGGAAAPAYAPDLE